MNTISVTAWVWAVSCGSLVVSFVSSLSCRWSLTTNLPAAHQYPCAAACPWHSHGSQPSSFRASCSTKVSQESQGQSVNERHGISFTLFRISSSHSVACKRGRWNKRGRGRLSPDETLCQCGQCGPRHEQCNTVHCPNTRHLRQTYGFSNV